MQMEEMAFEMAKALLARPAEEVVEIWRVGEEWAWSRSSRGPAAPAGAHLVARDLVHNADADPTDDPTIIADYAAEIIEWVRHAEARHEGH